MVKSEKIHSQRTIRVSRMRHIAYLALYIACRNYFCFQGKKLYLACRSSIIKCNDSVEKVVLFCPLEISSL